MKRFLSALLALFTILSLTFAFVSCGEVTPPQCDEHIDENGDGICDREGCGETLEVDPPTDSGDYFNENGELMLFRGGIPTFTVVKGSDVGAAWNKVDLLLGTLNKYSEGEDIEIKDHDSEPTPVEILIGTVKNREEKYTISKYSLGYNGYMVKQIENKIIVQGGSLASLEKAIASLEKDTFKITRTMKNYTDFAMSAEANKYMPQDNYKIKDITLAGNSIKSGYMLAYPKGVTGITSILTDIQSNLYINAGIYLPIERVDRIDGDRYILISPVENDGVSDGFSASVDDDGNMSIEYMFTYSLEDTLIDFFNTYFLNSKKETINYDAGVLNEAIDLRNITYEQYGAVGDGVADDFEALKAAHKAANSYGLIVHATAGKTYRLGHEGGYQSIDVKTDTYWHGASFIFDDYGILQSDPEYNTPIFHILPSVGLKTRYRIGDNNLPITSVEKGAQNIGFAPGFDCYIKLENANKKQYIRVGTWEDGGQNQKEYILVDKDGNVDPTTPIQWTFSELTEIAIYDINDQPIVISGADSVDEVSTITTNFNGSPFPNGYDHYTSRNIKITRSNVTIERIVHEFIGEDEVTSGQPYNGFIDTDSCVNITIRNITFQRPKRWTNTETGLDMSRSYEIHATAVTNISYIDCSQSNFFHDEKTGLNANNGMMGTNYCRNMLLDNCTFNTFDAHCGVYNATVRNSTLVYISIIGAGTLEVDNVTFYAARTDRDDAIAIWMRDDYGSTFDGDFIIKNINIKYNTYKLGSTTKERAVSVIDATWTDHYFGYDTTLPHNIYLENINATKMNVIVENGVRREEIVGVNIDPINIFSSKVADKIVDISKPGNNPITNAGGGSNPYAGPDNIYIKDCGDRTIARPTAPQFSSTKYYVYNTETGKYELN